MALPGLVFYDSTDTTIITAWAVGAVQAGQESAIFETWLWNNKGLAGADTALNLAVSIRDSNGQYIEAAVLEKWVRAKSSGINNPDSVPGFTDDLQTSFQALGAGATLKIGDLPNNCARKLTLKVAAPADALVDAAIVFTIRTTYGDNVKALPYFFNRAFGDGAIDEALKALFPAIEDTKAGVWTGAAGSAGAYTGTVKKKYWIKVTTGGALGTAVYVCSDDGVTYSATTITTSATLTTNVTDQADVDLGVDIDLRGITGDLSVGDIWTIDVDVVPFAIKAGTGLQGIVGPGSAFISNNHAWQNGPTIINALTPSTINYLFLGVDGAFTVALSSAAQADKILVGSFTTDATIVTAIAELYPLAVMNQELKLFVDEARKQSVSVLLPDPGGAAQGLTNFIAWKAPVDCTITKLQVIPHAAFISAASPNDTVIEVKKNNGATPVAALTVVTALAQGSINDLGALDAAEKVLAAGDNLTVDLTANGTGDIPALALQVDYLTN